MKEQHAGIAAEQERRRMEILAEKPSMERVNVARAALEAAAKEADELREQSARAELAAAGHDHDVQMALYDVKRLSFEVTVAARAESVTIDDAMSRTEEDAGQPWQEPRNTDPVRLALAEPLRAAVESFKAKIAEDAGNIVSAVEEKNAKLRELEAALVKSLALLPDDGARQRHALAAPHEQVANHRRVHEESRAGALTFHVRIKPYREMIQIGADLVKEGVAGMVATLAEYHARAAMARERGDKVENLDPCHVAAAALLGLRAACPELITRTGLINVIVHHMLVGDVSGATRRAAALSPLRALVSAWGGALTAGPIDDPGTPEELAEAKLTAALAANTEGQAVRAVNEASMIYHQARQAVEAQEMTRRRVG